MTITDCAEDGNRNEPLTTNLWGALLSILKLLWLAHALRLSPGEQPGKEKIMGSADGGEK